MHNTRRKGLPPEPFQQDLTTFERSVRKSTHSTQRNLNMENANDVPPGFNNVGDNRPNVGNTTHGYFAHPVHTPHYEIKTSFIQLLEARCLFYGLPTEDPNAHLANFLEVCSTFKISNMTEDEVWLRLFPFSLRDKAKQWIHALPRAGVNNWADLAKAFISKYFSMAKNAKLKRDTMLYQQHDGESIHKAWERYKEMQRKVPHHHITGENLIQNFYNGSTELGRSAIDVAAGGSLMKKTIDEAFALLDEMAMNGCTWPNERARVPAQKGVMAVTADPAVESLKAKNAALQAQVDILMRQTAGMNMGHVAAIQSICEVCGDPTHVSSDCYVMGQAFNEQVNFVGGQRQGNDPYAATYNQGWRNHPNFSQKDNGGNANNQAGPSFQGGQRPQHIQGNFQNHENFQNQGNFQHQNVRPQHPHGFQQREQGESLHSKFDKIMEMMMKKDAETQQTFKKHAATIHNLESRNQGGLPSTTEENPKEHLKAIELRSGKALDDPYARRATVEAEKEQCEGGEPEKVVAKPPPPPPFVPKVPFPHRVKKPQDTWKFHKFLETFKKLQINISLADTLREMSHYVKFLKEIITNKRSWDAEGPVPMTENCSSIILSSLPTKLKDPRSFTIPCTIGNMQSVNCLYDLGASINLMTLSLFRSMFGDQQVQATPMMLQLADHSLKKPHGIVEDVLVKVNKFIIPVDFVVLDYAADKECPMILGRPFMNTGRALIDVHDGKLTLWIEDESVEFDMRNITRHSNSGGECMRVDMVDELVEEQLAENKAIMQSMPSKEENDEEEEYIEEPPPKVELKTLPAHLRYAFLGADGTLPIIISNKLTKKQEQRVIDVVKGRILAIGWQISDIRGISPSVVMHQIHLEDESKASAQR
ncbi:uncharacterized protein LOC126678249 [Mercurialis annua]|uniref:uncharacterized protein LOC126678249 n=1 Tax=Mercurialis annua TaxID=3986 RepID=UPI00215EF955|nr:uncharacterized protein LOC126678249 [Mercurialis annua]